MGQIYSKDYLAKQARYIQFSDVIYEASCVSLKRRGHKNSALYPNFRCYIPTIFVPSRYIRSELRSKEEADVRKYCTLTELF